MLQGADQCELTPLVQYRLPMSEINRHEASRAQVCRRRRELLWGANVLLLVAICVWLLSDGRSQVVMWSLPRGAGITPALAASMVLGSLIGIFLTLFKGPPRYRSLKAWLCFTALVSAWCALVVSWQSVYWFGQTVRLRADVEAYEAVARELREDWPG